MQQAVDSLEAIARAVTIRRGYLRDDDLSRLLLLLLVDLKVTYHLNFKVLHCKQWNVNQDPVS